MPAYDFKVLNDKDFEVLVCELLNKKYDLELQSFKSGRDKGVDLRHSTSANNNSIVVQVKHYANSKFAQLKSALKGEFDKVELLKPQRYIVATSIVLSAAEKDEIKEIFDPYIQNSNDVFGNIDINALLGEFPEVEKNWFKLWLSSSSVLESIINNGIEARSEQLLIDIERKLSLYVITDKYTEAINKLLTERILLITGIPGVGKTSLAEFLIFNLASRGYKIYKIENVSEAESIFSRDSDKKQVFYFDDFLGSNYLDIISSGNSESQISSFVERVRNSDNKYLVLTSRTIIFNSAITSYEKINRLELQTDKFEIEITDYPIYSKALILYNHLYFGKLPPELLNVIYDNEFYFSIIKHRNYNPRIVEFITKNKTIFNFSPEEYKHFIANNLINPSEIWRFSFETQIDFSERALVQTLFTFNFRVGEKSLKKAFDERMRFDSIKYNRPLLPNQFDRSMKKLLESYIRSEIIDIDEKHRVYSFLSPSIGDFLLNFFNENEDDFIDTISSSVDISQIYKLCDSPRVYSEKIQKALIITILEKFSSRDIKNQDTNICCITIISSKCSPSIYESSLIKILENMVFSEESHTKQVYDFIKFLKLYHKDDKIYQFVTNHFYSIISFLIQNITTSIHAEDLPELFLIYGFDYVEYIKQDVQQNKIACLIDKVILNYEQELTSYFIEDVFDTDKVDEIYSDINSVLADITYILLQEEVNTDYYIDWAFWQGIIEDNQAKKHAEMFDDEESYSYIKPSASTLLIDDEDIRRLFSR